MVDKKTKVTPGPLLSGKRKSALLIIDVQNDFLPPEGSLAVKNGTEVISVINQLRDRVKFDHVAISQDWHPVLHVSFCSTHKSKGAILFNPFLLSTGHTRLCGLIIVFKTLLVHNFIKI